MLTGWQHVFNRTVRNPVFCWVTVLYPVAQDRKKLKIDRS